MLETLADRDPDTLGWRPLIARSWTISDDGLTITFKLRRGVSFSDGKPLTAHDVVFSYDLIMNPKIEAPRQRAYYGKIESVKANGDYEVTFKFRERYFKSFEVAATLDILPKHFYSKFTPAEFNAKPGLLMGSGPFRMETPDGWAPGKPLTLYRNERYWGVKPAFDRLVYREINNDVARLTAFKNGEIDFFPAQPEQYVKMLEDKALVDRTQHFEYERITGGYGFIGWNQKRGGKATVFADKRVRRAMTMMIDRQYIAKELLRGYGIIPTGPFNRLSPQYNPEVKPLPFDMAEAKQLLAEAGYVDRDHDSVLENAAGEPFKFALTYPSSEGGAGFWDRVMLLLKDQYAKAGIVMELDPLEWAVFAQKIDSRDFDAISLAWGGTLESDPYQIFHSDQMADGGDNFVNYSNPELDKAIDKARLIMDDEQRHKAWHVVHRILNDDQPYTFLYTRKSLVFVDDRIKNVQRVKIGLNSPFEWYVPKPLQKYK